MFELEHPSQKDIWTAVLGSKWSQSLLKFHESKRFFRESRGAAAQDTVPSWKNQMSDFCVFVHSSPAWQSGRLEFWNYELLFWKSCWPHKKNVDQNVLLQNQHSGISEFQNSRIPEFRNSGFWKSGIILKLWYLYLYICQFLQSLRILAEQKASISFFEGRHIIFWIGASACP